MKFWQDGALIFGATGYAFFNLEAYVVCVIILAIIIGRHQNYSGQTESGAVWCSLLFFQILFCFVEIFRVLDDIDIISGSYISQYITASAEFIILSIMCWLVFVYTETSQKSLLLNTLINKIIFVLPLLLNIIIFMISSFTDSFINTSDNINILKTEKLFPVMILINIAYPFSAFVRSVLRRCKMTKYENSMTVSTSIYPAFFAIFVPFQLINWKIPLMCHAILIADILIYINHIDSLISIDPLTKISNRNALIKTLSEILMNGSTKDLYVFAADIDDLSSINSNYGRNEGDRALIVTAEALKKFRNEEHKCYTARYYGDEFMLIAEIENAEKLELFVEHIKNYVRNASISNRLPYHLRMSIGWAKYEPFSKTETVSGLIDEADRVLKENKEQKKFQKLWTGTLK